MGGKKRFRRLSTLEDERKEQRRSRDSQAQDGEGGADNHPATNSSNGSDDVQLRVTTDIDADEHQWLLASVKSSWKQAVQLTAEARLCPPLIDEQQLIASSDDDLSPPLPSSPDLLSPDRRRAVDLVSSYEQLSFIRFPPRLTSLSVARYVWAAAGLMEVGWLRVGHEGETGTASMYANAAWAWQSCWLVLCLCALAASTAAEWSDDTSAPRMDRVVLAACWCVSVVAAVLLSHRVLAQRLIGTRIYHLYHNAQPPRSSLSAIDRTLYSSLFGLSVLLCVGLYTDLTNQRRTLLLTASTMNGAVGAAHSSLWYACTALLRVQLAAGDSLAVCLLDVHRQRVEQSREVVMHRTGRGADEKDNICAHLLDIELCVSDLSDCIGTHVVAIVAASALSALVLVVRALAIGTDVQLLSILAPLLLATYVLVAAARLNQVGRCSPRTQLSSSANSGNLSKLYSHSCTCWTALLC